MCFKGSFSKWRSRNYIHYIIERHGPGESRHYCWSMTFKVHDWADRTRRVLFGTISSCRSQHTGANALLLCIILHRLINTCFIPAISRSCTLWSFLSTASILSVIHSRYSLFHTLFLLLILLMTRPGVFYFKSNFHYYCFALNLPRKSKTAHKGLLKSLKCYTSSFS